MGVMLSRREFGGLVAGVPLSAQAATRIQPPTRDAVHFGLQTFSFHDLPPPGDPRLLPTIVGNMREIGLAECEIMSSHVEPWPSYTTGWWVQSRRAPGFAKIREDARRWRLGISMDHYRGVLDDAGLRIHLYNINFNETFTDDERDRTFEAAAALGVAGISSSTVLSEAERLVPFVERHKMFVAMHNHNNLVDPDQFATPASLLPRRPRRQGKADRGWRGRHDQVAVPRPAAARPRRHGPCRHREAAASQADRAVERDRPERSRRVPAE